MFILRYYDRVLSHFEEGFNVDVIYLDFAKAFHKPSQAKITWH